MRWNVRCANTNRGSTSLVATPYGKAPTRWRVRSSVASSRPKGGATIGDLPLHCFNSITVRAPELGDDWARVSIEVDPVGRPEGQIDLRYKYQEDLPDKGTQEFEDLEYLFGLTALCP